MCLKNVFSETSKLFMEEITEEKLINRSGRELTQLHAQIDNIFNVERNRIFNKYINPNPKPAREHDVEALKQQLQKTTSELHKYKSNHSLSSTSQVEYETKIRRLTEKNNQYEEKLQKYDKIVRVMLNKIKNLSIQQLEKEPEPKPEPEPGVELEPESESEVIEPETNVELTPVQPEESIQNELSDIEEEGSFEEEDLVIKRV
jgi:chromosome segregation ATPase